MKPDMVFFGERISGDVVGKMTKESDKVDLVLVMGTSLAVAPISKVRLHHLCTLDLRGTGAHAARRQVLDLLPPSVPRLLLNRDLIKNRCTTPLTAALLGDADATVHHLVSVVRCYDPFCFSLLCRIARPGIAQYVASVHIVRAGTQLAGATVVGAGCPHCRMQPPTTAVVWRVRLACGQWPLSPLGTEATGPRLRSRAESLCREYRTTLRIFSTFPFRRGCNAECATPAKSAPPRGHLLQMVDLGWGEEPATSEFAEPPPIPKLVQLGVGSTDADDVAP